MLLGSGANANDQDGDGRTSFRLASFLWNTLHRDRVAAAAQRWRESKHLGQGRREASIPDGTQREIKQSHRCRENVAYRDRYRIQYSKLVARNSASCMSVPCSHRMHVMHGIRSIGDPTPSLSCTVFSFCVRPSIPEIYL